MPDQDVIIMRVHEGAVSSTGTRQKHDDDLCSSWVSVTVLYIKRKRNYYRRVTLLRYVEQI